MPLQNFVDGGLPLIAASWLNKVDVLLTTVFQDAVTPAQALAALGFSAYGISLVTVADAAAARTLLGATSTGSALFTTASAAAARATLGATAVGGSVFTAADATAARTAIGATATGAALFTTASVAAAQATLGGLATGISLFGTATPAAARTILGLTTTTGTSGSIQIGTQLIQWGTGTVPANAAAYKNSTTVTFATAFASAPTFCIATSRTATGSSTAGVVATCACTGESTTQMTVNADVTEDDSTAAYKLSIATDFFYLAIGTAV